MKLYVVYYIEDHNDPIAISLDREQAERYAYKINKREKWSRAYVRTIILTDKIVELDIE